MRWSRPKPPHRLSARCPARINAATPESEVLRALLRCRRTSRYAMAKSKTRRGLICRSYPDPLSDAACAAQAKPEPSHSRLAQTLFDRCCAPPGKWIGSAGRHSSGRSRRIEPFDLGASSSRLQACAAANGAWRPSTAAGGCGITSGDARGCGVSGAAGRSQFSLLKYLGRRDAWIDYAAICARNLMGAPGDGFSGNPRRVFAPRSRHSI